MLEKIGLYRMTHIDNIPHILQYGIVHRSSPNRNPNFIPIGDKSLISFRDSKIVSVKGKRIVLGNYIPFYFGIRMPMLYVIQHGLNFVEKARRAEEIVYLVVSVSKIVNNGFHFYFSDGHATDSLTTFFDENDINNLPTILDWNAIKAQYWAGDGIETDTKRRKQAEFLINGDIPPSYIVGFVCYNEAAKTKLLSFGINENKIKVFPKAYY